MAASANRHGSERHYAAEFTHLINPTGFLSRNLQSEKNLEHRIYTFFNCALAQHRVGTVFVYISFVD